MDQDRRAASRAERALVWAERRRVVTRWRDEQVEHVLDALAARWPTRFAEVARRVREGNDVVWNRTHSVPAPVVVDGDLVEAGTNGHRPQRWWVSESEQARPVKGDGRWEP